VRDRVLISGTSVLVRDTSIDDAYRERRSIVEQNIRTLMAVPLQTRDEIIGNHLRGFAFAASGVHEKTI